MTHDRTENHSERNQQTYCNNCERKFDCIRTEATQSDAVKFLIGAHMKQMASLLNVGVSVYTRGRFPDHASICINGKVHRY